MKTGILLLGHGSRREAANRGLERLAGLVQAGLGVRVLPAFFQFGRPSLPDVVEHLVGEGVDEIVVVPAFLFPGMHLEHDVPEALEEINARYGYRLKFKITPCVGADPRLAEILLERIRSAGVLSPDGAQTFGPELTDPDAITSHSRCLIEASLGEDFFRERFSGAEGEVVRRVVHAMGNPSVAGLMRFHPEALEVGLSALKKGALLFTDVRMVKIGINRSGLRELGGRAVCLIHHPRVCRIAREEGLTRALVAVRCYQDLWRGQIVVVGNAPTALSEVLRLSARGVRPALIIGTPVGFVGAAEVKARLANQDVPYITLLGNQGGSTAAVAVVNAMISLARGGAGL
ncbi:MAG TPA: precorrin isomerase [Syntrophomonadaceae bacterium]|nr:precorrin isomerase [Syntrophomonadaceae bacterium]